VIDSFVPAQYLTQIEQMAEWDDDTGEWQLPGVAHTGNSTRATAAAAAAAAAEDLPPANPTIELDLEKQFFRHGNMIDESRPPKTARPKAGKSKRADSSSSSLSKEGKSRREKKEDRDGQVYPESRPQTAKTRYA